MTDGPLVDVDVIGATRLSQTLNVASEALKSLDKAHAEAGAIALAAARAKAPRRTGRLASTGATVRIPHGVGITFTAIYANPIHWGWKARGVTANPWVTKAAQATEPRWFGAYVDETEDALGKVKGA